MFITLKFLAKVCERLSRETVCRVWLCIWNPVNLAVDCNWWLAVLFLLLSIKRKKWGRAKPLKERLESKSVCYVVSSMVVFTRQSCSTGTDVTIRRLNFANSDSFIHFKAAAWVGHPHWPKKYSCLQGVKTAKIKKIWKKAWKIISHNKLWTNFFNF